MNKAAFLKLIKAWEGMKSIDNTLTSIMGECSGGEILSETMENLEYVISIYSKNNYDFVTQEQQYGYIDGAYEDFCDVLCDTTKTTKQKCEILYDVKKTKQCYSCAFSS